MLSIQTKFYYVDTLYYVNIVWYPVFCRYCMVPCIHQVLYGALLMADKNSIYTSPLQPPTASQQEHNILPLSTCSNRFPLLPLSMQNRSTTIQPILQPPKSKVETCIVTLCGSYTIHYNCVCYTCGISTCSSFSCFS